MQSTSSPLAKRIKAAEQAQPTQQVIVVIVEVPTAPDTTPAIANVPDVTTADIPAPAPTKKVVSLVEDPLLLSDSDESSSDSGSGSDSGSESESESGSDSEESSESDSDDGSDSD